MTRVKRTFFGVFGLVAGFMAGILAEIVLLSVIFTIGTRGGEAGMVAVAGAVFSSLMYPVLGVAGAVAGVIFYKKRLAPISASFPAGKKELAVLLIVPGLPVAAFLATAVSGLISLYYRGVSCEWARSALQGISVDYGPLPVYIGGLAVLSIFPFVHWYMNRSSKGIS